MLSRSCLCAGFTAVHVFERGYLGGVSTTLQTAIFTGDGPSHRTRMNGQTFAICSQSCTDGLCSPRNRCSDGCAPRKGRVSTTTNTATLAQVQVPQECGLSQDAISSVANSARLRKDAMYTVVSLSLPSTWCCFSHHLVCGLVDRRVADHTAGAGFSTRDDAECHIFQEQDTWQEIREHRGAGAGAGRGNASVQERVFIPKNREQEQTGVGENVRGHR